MNDSSSPVESHGGSIEAAQNPEPTGAAASAPTPLVVSVRGGSGWIADLGNVVRGYCMGAADIVPGVSGGTVALILGHYDRLVAAISHFDSTMLGLLRQRRLRAAAQHGDLRFVAGIGFGIGLGVLSLASLLHFALENHLPETLSLFFGLVLASCWIVAQQLPRWRWIDGLLVIVAATVTYYLCSLSTSASDPSLPFLFVAAAIAICAMILPGISGAFVLLLLGAYHPVTGLLRDLTRFDVTATGLLRLAVFVSGCAVGLAVFSRLLRWCLQHQHAATYAVLLGLMLGSLRRLWPLQQATAATAEEKFSHRQFEIIPIDRWPESLLPLIGLALAAATVVLIAEAIKTMLSRSSTSTHKKTSTSAE